MRSIFCDRFVLKLFNLGILKKDDFDHSESYGFRLHSAPKKKLLALFSDELVSEKLYLFCYDFPSDLAGDKRRKKVMKILEGQGERVQYSIFEARLKSFEELQALIKRIEKYLEKKEDSLRIYPLPLNVEKEIIILGQGEVFRRKNAYVF